MDDSAVDELDLWMSRLEQQTSATDDQNQQHTSTTSATNKNQGKTAATTTTATAAADDDDDDEDALAALRRGGGASKKHTQLDPRAAAGNRFHAVPAVTAAVPTLSLEADLHLASRSHNALSEPNKEERLRRWKALLDEAHNDAEDDGNGNNKHTKSPLPRGSGLIDDQFDVSSVASYASIFTQAWTLEADSLLQRRARAQLTSEMVFTLEVERDEGRRRLAMMMTTAAQQQAAASTTTTGLQQQQQQQHKQQHLLLTSFDRQFAHLPPPRSLHFSPCSQVAQQCLDEIQRDRFAAPEKWLILLREICSLPLNKVRHIWQYAVKTFPSATWLVLEYVELEIQAERQLHENYKSNLQHYHNQQQQQQQGTNDHLQLMVARLRILDIFDSHMRVCVASSLLHARFLRYVTETVGGLDARTEYDLCTQCIRAVGRTFDAYQLWRVVLERRQGLLDERSVRVTRELFHALLVTPIDKLDQAKVEYLEFEKHVQRRDNISQTLQPAKLATAHRQAVDEFSERRNLWEIIAQRQSWPGGVTMAASALGGNPTRWNSSNPALRIFVQNQQGSMTMTSSSAATTTAATAQVTADHPITSSSPWCAPSTTDPTGTIEFNFSSMQTLPQLLPQRPSDVLHLSHERDFLSQQNPIEQQFQQQQSHTNQQQQQQHSYRAQSDSALAGTNILGYHAAWDALIELESGAVSFSGSGAGGAGSATTASSSTMTAVGTATTTDPREATIRARRVCNLWEQRCRCDPHSTPAHWLMWARARRAFSIAFAKLKMETLSAEARRRDREEQLNILFEGLSRFPDSVVLANALADTLTNLGDIRCGNNTLFQLTQYNVAQAKTLFLLEQELNTTAAAMAIVGGGGGNNTSSAASSLQSNLLQVQAHGQATARRVQAMQQILRARNSQTLCDVADAPRDLDDENDDAAEDDESNNKNDDNGDDAEFDQENEAAASAARKRKQQQSQHQKAGGSPIIVTQYVVPLIWRFCDRPRSGDWVLGTLHASLFEPAALNPVFQQLQQQQSQNQQNQQQRVQQLLATLRSQVKDSIAFGCVAWMRWLLRSKQSPFWEATLGGAAQMIVLEQQQQQAQQHENAGNNNEQQQQLVDTALLHMRSVARYAVANCGVGRHSLFLHAWAQLEAGCGSPASAAAAVGRLCTGWERNIVAALASAGAQLSGWLEETTSEKHSEQRLPSLLRTVDDAVSAVRAVARRVGGGGSNQQQQQSQQNQGTASTTTLLLADCGGDALFFQSLQTLDFLRSACGVSNTSNNSSSTSPILAENATRARLAAALFTHVVSVALEFIAQSCQFESDKQASQTLVDAATRFCREGGFGAFPQQQQQQQNAAPLTPLEILQHHCPQLYSLMSECRSLNQSARCVQQMIAGCNNNNNNNNNTSSLSQRIAAAMRAAQAAVGGRSTQVFTDVSVSGRAIEADDEAQLLTSSSSSLFSRLKQNNSQPQQLQPVASSSAFVRPDFTFFNRLPPPPSPEELAEQQRRRQEQLREYQRQMYGMVRQNNNNNQQQHQRGGGANSSSNTLSMFGVRRLAVDLFDPALAERHATTTLFSWDAAIYGLRSKATAPSAQAQQANPTNTAASGGSENRRRAINAATSEAALKALLVSAKPLHTQTRVASLATRAADADIDAVMADLALTNVDGATTAATATTTVARGKKQEQQQQQQGEGTQASMDEFALKFSSSALARLLHRLPSSHGLGVRPGEPTAAEVMQRQKRLGGGVNGSEGAFGRGEDEEENDNDNTVSVNAFSIDDVVPAAANKQRGVTAATMTNRNKSNSNQQVDSALYPRTQFVLQALLNRDNVVI